MLTYEDICKKIVGKNQKKYRNPNDSKCFLYAEIGNVRFIFLSGTGDYEGKIKYNDSNIINDKEIHKVYDNIINNFWKNIEIFPCKLNDNELAIYDGKVVKLRDIENYKKNKYSGLYSCCERKLLARLFNNINQLNRCTIYCKSKPCEKCTPFLNEKVEYYFYDKDNNNNATRVLITNSYIPFYKKINIISNSASTVKIKLNNDNLIFSQCIWTIDEDQELIEDYNIGDIAKIAKKHFRSEKAIECRIKKLGL